MALSQNIIQEETKTEKTIKSSQKYTVWVKKALMSISVPMGLISLFMEMGVVLVMILGTYFLHTEQITASFFVLALILSMAFTSSISKITTFQHFKIVFNASMKSIGSILGVKVNASKPEKNNDIKRNDVEISSLDFSYNSETKTLNNLNIIFEQNTKNALVGSSGCGKTTLANLIMGFWNPDKGSIKISDVNINSLNEKQLNSLISIVQQDVFLFNTTLEENIKIGNPNCSKEDIIKACKKAKIHDFIDSLPNGYQTIAGESGVKFSGGEKQRISIARMILKNASIVILDEATSAVDDNNEAYIQEAIRELSKNKTIITIAHNLNSITDYDQIVVMEKGKVIDKGKHEELIKRCDLYKEMYDCQNKVNNWVIKEA